MVNKKMVDRRTLKRTHSVTPEHACSPAINQHLEVIESHELPSPHRTRSEANTTYILREISDNLL